MLTAKVHVARGACIWGFFLALAISCLSAFAWFYNLDAPGLVEGQEIAQPIIAAVQSYRQVEGKYPGRIDDLTPNYLSEIPEASWRHSFCYDLRDDGLSFTLAFVPKGEAIGDGWYVYVSKMDRWRLVNSDFVQPCHFLLD